MFPNNTLQFFCSPWWEKDSQKTLKRGRLIQAYVPHVDQIPNELQVIGRSQATIHDRAEVKITPLRFNQVKGNTGLPVAALPNYTGETYAA